MSTVFNDDEIREFINKGFIRVDKAFSKEVAEEGREVLWRLAEKIEPGLSPDSPESWKEPVVRIEESDAKPFRIAANSSRLHDAFNQIVGVNRWKGHEGMGTFPIRFPSSKISSDTGWHVDGSYIVDGKYFVNLWSKHRALLLLFLFSDVTKDDAPTRMKVGSHLGVAKLLAAAGKRGMGDLDSGEYFKKNLKFLEDYPEELATGEAGDVYLCHPFSVHAASSNLKPGHNPRFISQPRLRLRSTGILVLEREDSNYSPIEQAVRLGLGIPVSTKEL